MCRPDIIINNNNFKIIKGSGRLQWVHFPVDVPLPLY